MNFKLLSTTALIATTILANSNCLAHAEEGNNDKKYYVQLNAGASISNKKTVSFTVNNKTYTGTGNIPSGLVGLEAGMKFADNFRLSLSLDYRPVYPFDIKNGGKNVGVLDASSLATMANVYYDFTNSSSFTPYLTLGAGFANNQTKVDQKNNGLSVSKKSTDNFAYKIGLGSKYEINNSFDIDLRYQFVDLGKYKFSDSASYSGVSYPVINQKSISMRAHEVLFGLAYKF